MKSAMWRVNAVTVAILSLATCAMAAQPEAQPAPKAPKAQSFGYWVGDVPGSRGSYLGVDVADVTKDRVSALKLKDERGVEVTMVDQDAPAGKAGLKEHDVILEYNGTRIEGEEQLRRMIHETPAGRKVTLGVSRDGQMLQLPVTLGERSKANSAWATPMIAPNAMPAFPAIPATPAPPGTVWRDLPEIDVPDVNVMVRSYSRSSGMMIDNLTPQLGEYFGVKSGQGVLVRSVEKGSAAEKAGLKAGDVIVKLGDEKITDRGDFTRALRDRKSGKMQVGIVREKREQNLTLTLPEPKSKDQSKVRGRIWRSDDKGDWIDGDDMDIDIDVDMDDIEGAAAALAHQAKDMALLNAKQGVLTAQANMSVTLKKLQPQLEKQMNEVQKKINEEMKKAAEEMQRELDKD